MMPNSPSNSVNANERTAKDLDLPEFSIFILGTRGAGKTTYLSSMYHALCVSNEKRDYYIKISDNQIGVLHDEISCLLDESNPEFPRATPEPRQFNFSTIYFRREGAKRIPVFKIKYFDYPGGYVTDGYQSGQHDFTVSEAARDAHAILVLLDGQKVLDVLENYPDQKRRNAIYKDINALCPILMDCLGKPIHFAITKCDLIDRNIYSLEAIRDVVLKSNLLRRVIMAQETKWPIHIVPISAVGTGFASYDRHSGKVTRIPDAQLNPLNVELSIVLTLMDQVKLCSDSLKVDLRRKIDYETIKADLIVNFSRLTGRIVEWSPVARLLTTSSGEAVLIFQLIRGIDSFFQNKKESLQGALDKMRARASDQQSAFLAIIAHEASMYQRFISRLPAAVIKTSDIKQ